MKSNRDRIPSAAVSLIMHRARAGCVGSLILVLAGTGCARSGADDEQSKRRSDESSESSKSSARGKPAKDSQQPEEPKSPEDSKARCRADADCEACATPTDCGCMTALADDGCPATMHDCAEDPCTSYRARCDLDQGRCVLAKHDEQPLGKFSVSLSCDQHGAGISTHLVEVQSSPAFIRTEVNDQPEQTAKLGATDLYSLRDVLRTEAFAAFAKETPKKGKPHPGIKYCTLDVKSAALDVRGKKWSSADELSPAAAEGRESLQRELGALHRKLIRTLDSESKAGAR